MKIVGLQKLTLLDYPGRMACTVFLDGCNFRCPYCHNSELLTRDVEPIMTADALLAFLRKRQGILEGVCITGGEPTLHPELPDLIRSIRTLGYKIKLDTNGYRPEALADLLEQKLLDYVAMDLKNSPSAYGETVGLNAPDLDKITKSIRHLLDSGVEFELRTTVVFPLHSDESIREMAEWLLKITGGRRVPRLFLQPFVDRETVPMGGFSAPNGGQLAEYQRILAPSAAEVGIRGT